MCEFWPLYQMREMADFGCCPQKGKGAVVARARGEMVTDDSTGKSRTHDARTRSYVLFVTFLGGLCVGFIVAQRVYVRVQNQLSGEANPRAGAPSSLVETLNSIAPQKEVLVTISDMRMMQGEKMLQLWLDCVRRAEISNFVVVALDKELEILLKEQSVPVHFHPFDMSSSIQDGTGNNHAISAQKYGILEAFLIEGWSVLLSDTDVAILQNPFPYLYRDHDIEAMSDGFDEATAYGSIDSVDDASMGWSRYAQGTKHYNLNSGLFFISANKRTADLMKRLKTRLSKAKYWDQSAFNEEIFFLSHGKYISPQVSVRVMEIDLFMNSKYLFKIARFKKINGETPVLVHINYHPDKFLRMKAVIARFTDKDMHALDRFPGGSEPGT